jgi:hypothetical protein
MARPIIAISTYKMNKSELSKLLPPTQNIMNANITNTTFPIFRMPSKVDVLGVVKS